MTGSGRDLKVSIGLPVRNGERYLASTLESLTAQTLTNLEIIIGDNASTDGTEAICRDFAAADPRIQYLRTELDRGAAWNYNRVAERARGTYFKWAAHDDELAPEYLAACVAELEAHPDAVLAFPDTIVIDDQGEREQPLDYPLDASASRRTRRYSAFQRFFSRMRPFQCNAIFGVFRTSALRETKLLGSHWGSDAVLLAELVLKGPFRHIAEPLFFRRDHAGRSMRQNRRPEDIATWFDPQHTGSPHFPQWQCCFQQWHILRNAPLGLAERARCVASLLRWTAKRPLVRELRRWRRRKWGQTRADASLPKPPAPTSDTEHRSEARIRG